MGKSVARRASHFIYAQHHFVSVVLTNILDTPRQWRGTVVRCHNALRHRENILQRCSGCNILIVKKKKKGWKSSSVSSFCLIILSIVLSIILLPSPLLSLPSLPYPLILYACRFAHTSLCACQIHYQRQGTFWHLLIGECCWVFVRWKSNCNLTVQNSTPAVSALYAL